MDMEMVCKTCTDTRPKTSFITTSGCEHVYCITCVQNYAEVKLESGSSIIRCLEWKCDETFDESQLNKILSPTNLKILMFRQLEASIPPMLRVYCPYKDCSVPMERSCNDMEMVEMEMVECINCYRGFCAKCISPWHDNMTCSENADKSEDKKLLDMAKKKKWIACNACHQMVERESGCNEIKCRCGNVFCYNCGETLEACEGMCEFGDDGMESLLHSKFYGERHAPYEVYKEQTARSPIQGKCNIREGRGSMLGTRMDMQQNLSQNQPYMQKNGLEVHQNVQNMGQDVERMQRDMRNMQQVVERTRKYVQDMQQRKKQLEEQNMQ